LLIVDDEQDMLDFLERVLRRFFDVQRCSSAEEAQSLLTERGFDVLVTDQKMPRMTGLELLEDVGERYPNMAKILLSGFTEMPEIQKAVERGSIHNYIVKPVDGDRLLEAIDEARSRRATGGTFKPTDA